MNFPTSLTRPGTVDIIVPTLREQEVKRLVYSLEKQTRWPDVVTIVSNEVEPFSSLLNVRFLKFTSTRYPVGYRDVALRQNVGAFESSADVLIFQNDDQVAPPTMVEDALEVLGDRPFIWGHHRITPFEGKTTDEIRLAYPGSGESREDPPNHQHSARSAYGGMLVIRRLMFMDIGGFDMAFLCRHAGEDQQLGHRLALRHSQKGVFVHEPPFSWMDPVRPPWNAPKVINVDAEHDLIPVLYYGIEFTACTHCPYITFAGKDDHALFRTTDRPVLEYDPRLVTTASERFRPTRKPTQKHPEET